MAHNNRLQRTALGAAADWQKSVLEWPSRSSARRSVTSFASTSSARFSARLRLPLIARRFDALSSTTLRSAPLPPLLQHCHNRHRRHHHHRHHLQEQQPHSTTTSAGRSLSGSCFFGAVIGLSLTRTTAADAVTIQVRPWTWTDVVWHYRDGSSAVYPACDRIDWSKQ